MPSPECIQVAVFGDKSVGNSFIYVLYNQFNVPWCFSICFLDLLRLVQIHYIHTSCLLILLSLNCMFIPVLKFHNSLRQTMLRVTMVVKLSKLTDPNATGFVQCQMRQARLPMSHGTPEGFAKWTFGSFMVHPLRNQTLGKETQGSQLLWLQLAVPFSLALCFRYVA